MKKSLLTIAVLFFVLMSVSSFALTNFEYRGVAFNSSGEIMANQTVGLTIELIKTSGVVYEETHTGVSTNQFGAYTVEVGSGTVVGSVVLGDVTATKDLKIKSTIDGGGVWVVATILKPTVAITYLGNGGDFVYRGVAFDGSGEIMASQTVNLTIELIKTSGIVYEETHTGILTNQFGAYTVEIGSGTVVSGVLANVTITKDLKIKSTIDGGGVWVVATIVKPTVAITYFGSGNADLDSVTIGTQTWSAKNLDVTTYRNGDIIPQVTDATEWANLTTGAWCYYNNDQSNNATYGKLYNWYAVNDPRGLAPTGWHVPTDNEWKTLEMELGMTQAEADATGWRGTDEGSQLAGNAALWTDGNLESNAAFGTSGFDGLPGGSRNSSGSFFYVGGYANWWSSSEYSGTYAWNRTLTYARSDIDRYYFSKEYGFSVRLVKD